jgi:hypothetical protein
MIIHGDVNYNLLAPLCWTIADTASMDLGGSHVDLSVGGSTDAFKKMTDRHANLTAQVINFTNINLRLFAVVATDSAKAARLVDTTNPQHITTNELTELIDHPTPGSGFVSLLGKGILIPPRDSMTKVTNAVTLSEDDLTQILGAKNSGWRWQVRFLPQDQTGAIVPDALSNTDWIKMNSWIHVDGVNSVDSLFSK